MSVLRTQVGLVRLVAATIGMTACAPRFVSLPSNLRADAQQIEYRTSAFTVRAPRGRWATDSAMRVGNFEARYLTCESPYDSVVLGGVVGSYVESGRNRTPLGVVRIRFFRIVRMQVLTGHPESDADACIIVMSYPLIRHDSSIAAQETILGFFKAFQPEVRKLSSFACSWHGFWGTHVSNGIGRLHELRIGGRTFYQVALVSVTDPTKLCEDHGVELLYVAQGKVFAVYVSSPGILKVAMPVAESLMPRD